MWLQRILRPKNKAGFQPKSRKTQRKFGNIKLSSKAIRQLDRLQLSGNRILRGASIGQRPGQRRKPASDFLDHRMYVPGDDIRYVDWRASARHEQTFIRQGDLPKDNTVYLFLDCSGSMQWGEDPKSRAQLELAAALGYLTLNNRDRLMIVPFGGKSNLPLGPISGKGQVTTLLDYLNKLNYGQTAGLFQVVKRLSGQTTRKGLVFILSDFLDLDSLSPILELLPAPFWLVNILHMLHPEELHPPQFGNIELVDSETGEAANYDISRGAIKQYQEQLMKWQERLDLDCVENHAFYTLFPTDWNLEREMIAHLRSTLIVNPI